MFEAYYYLISSLPLPRWDAPPPLSETEFLESCADQLGPDRFRRIQAVRLEPVLEPISLAYTGWVRWETCFRNALARRRAARLGIEPERWLRPEEDAWPHLVRQVEEIMGADTDPWTRQTRLDRLRWRRLDELEAGHYFDFDALVVYKLRILLLEQRSRYSQEAGEKAFATLLDRVCREAAQKRVVRET